MTQEEKKQELIEYLKDKDKTFTIYHIPGVKVGCDCNIERDNNRPKQQGYEEWEILHQTKDIFEASRLEKKEQKERGYKMDGGSYWLSYFNFINNRGWKEDIWLGKKRTDSNKKKLSIARTGMKFTEEHKHNISLAKTGTTQSNETKLKKSIKMKGIKKSEETKIRMREAWILRKQKTNH